jgi:hypothetical protein
MHHRRTFLLVAAAVTLSTALPTGAGADDVTYQKLFFIQRSKNANEVHYDARVAKDGNLDPKEPLTGYWIDKADDPAGHKRSGISLLQKVAYGYDTDPGPNGTYNLKLKAFKDRAMSIVKTDGGKWRVKTLISGKEAYMTRLYVATDESGVMPKVLYVDVFGEATGGGAPVQEHIVKN